ncbi:MAG TPA: hypothetical protein VGB66_13965 [Longimicrobium sp.]|jgi:hypothetical protein
MKPASRMVTVAVVVLLASGGSAAAQESRPSVAGFALGTHAVGMSSDRGAAAPRRGGGVGGFIGMGVTRHVMVLLNVDLAAGAFQDDESIGLLGHADIAARVAPFRAGVAFPYLQGAFSSGLREATADRQLQGTGWTVGGGVEVVLSPMASLDLAVLRTRVRHDELTGSGPGDPVRVREATTRVQLGTVWRPPFRP